MDNRIISIALVVSKALIWVAIALFVAFTIMIIHWHFNPEAYAYIDVSKAFKAGFGVNVDIKLSESSKNAAINAVWMSELNHGMVYWIFIRSSFFLIISILILQKVIKVLQSIKSLKTFYKDNIIHFQQMAKLAFVAFLLSCFNIDYHDGEYGFHLKSAFGPLIFALACLVLAEIFKEGRRLLEDQKLIV